MITLFLFQKVFFDFVYLFAICKKQGVQGYIIYFFQITEMQISVIKSLIEMLTSVFSIII